MANQSAETVPIEEFNKLKRKLDDMEPEFQANKRELEETKAELKKEQEKSKQFEVLAHKRLATDKEEGELSSSGSDLDETTEAKPPGSKKKRHRGGRQKQRGKRAGKICKERQQETGRAAGILAAEGKTNSGTERGIVNFGGLSKHDMPRNMCYKK